MVWWWRQMPMQSRRQQISLPLEIHILAPRIATVQRHQQTEPAPTHVPPERGRAEREREILSSAPVIPPASPRAETPQSIPGATTLNLSETARRSAGAIDREIRQSGAARAGREVQLGQTLTALGRGIASAGQPRGTTMQEVTASDGRLMTKVITPSGVYCVWGRRPGAGISESELAALKTTTCP